MRNLIALMVLAFVLPWAPALAAHGSNDLDPRAKAAWDLDKDGCVSAEELSTKILADYPGAFLVETLTGAKAKEFLRIYNALPPPTNQAGDTIIVYDHPRQRTAYFVAMLVDGCAVKIGPFTRRGYDMIRRQVKVSFGQEA